MSGPVDHINVDATGPAGDAGGEGRCADRPVAARDARIAELERFRGGVRRSGKRRPAPVLQGRRQSTRRPPAARGRGPRPPGPRHGGAWLHNGLGLSFSKCSQLLGVPALGVTAGAPRPCASTRTDLVPTHDVHKGARGAPRRRDGTARSELGAPGCSWARPAAASRRPISPPQPGRQEVRAAQAKAIRELLEWLSENGQNDRGRRRRDERPRPERGGTARSSERHVRGAGQNRLGPGRRRARHALCRLRRTNVGRRVAGPDHLAAASTRQLPLGAAG